MYESPITLINKEIMYDLFINVEMPLINTLSKMEMNGIKVDKDELIKALKYDRGQYEKGYEDAKAEQKKGEWINDRGLYRCSVCNELWVEWWAVCMEPARMYKEMKYCPKCGAEMKEGVCNG